MKSSNSTIKTVLAVSLLVLSPLANVLVVAQTPGASKARPGRAGNGTVASRRTTTAAPKGQTTETIKQDVTEAIEVIKRNYVGGTALNYNDVFKASIDGMLRALDPHSNYFDPVEFDELRNDQRSEYSGIGASIANQVRGENVDTYITATFEGSPAWRAGLRFGDRIVKVDGVDMHGKPSTDVRDKIRGPKGSTVKITVERAADGRTDLVNIVRNTVPQPSVPDAYMIGEGVGYVDMTRGFNYDTSDGLQNALDYLQARGMNSLVLDLRGNPGGFLEEAYQVASKFLQYGQLVVSQRGRTASSERNWRVTSREPNQVSLVILVNEGSASASEIVSGAIQDHDRGLIVGENTFGKGLVQTIIPLDYGAGLTLTSAKYYTPSGRLIQRDYSGGGLYDYYTHGGSNPRHGDPSSPPSPASKTDSGREVFGGNGIAPDITVKPQTVTRDQARLMNPVFFFARELVNGRVAGFESAKLGPVDFRHRLQVADFPVTDALYQKFVEFAEREPLWKTALATTKNGREFVNLQLRFELAMAAFGSVTATQVLIDQDPQVKAAVASLPRAKELARNSNRPKQTAP